MRKTKEREKKSEQLLVRISQAEKENLRKVANVAGLGISEYTRQAIKKYEPKKELTTWAHNKKPQRLREGV